MNATVIFSVLVALATSGLLALIWVLRLIKRSHELAVIGEILARALVFINHARLVKIASDSGMRIVTAYRKHGECEKALEVEWGTPNEHTTHTSVGDASTSNILIRGTLRDPYDMGREVDGVRYRMFAFQIWYAENPNATTDSNAVGLTYALTLTDEHGRVTEAGNALIPRVINAKTIEREGFDLLLEEIVDKVDADTSKHATSGTTG